MPVKEPMPSPFDILDFWWRAGPSKWFARDDAFDREIAERFGAAVEAAIEGAFEDWTGTPHGSLALLLLLDQFTRNIHRGRERAFAGDARALQIAQAAVEREFDRAFPKEARTFFYLPFEHAETMEAQERSVDLFRRNGVEKEYLYALIHLDVIRRFGRFPHRNAALGRETTAAESAFLADGGFSA